MGITSGFRSKICLESSSNLHLRIGIVNNKFSVTILCEMFSGPLGLSDELSLAGPQNERFLLLVLLVEW